MGRSEEIAEFVEDSGGIASAAQIAKAGFLPGSISYALESGAIDKLTRGVYCLPEVFDDEFAAISYRWSKCVLSHGSALSLAGLSDKVAIVAVSRDLPFAQARWCGAAGVKAVETLSDYRDGSFGRAFGVYISELGLLARCVFIVKDGVVQYVQLVPEVTDQPDFDDVLRAVKKLS